MGMETRLPSQAAPMIGEQSSYAFAATLTAFMPAIASFAVVTAVGIAGGGFRPDTWRLSTIALVALGAAALLVREPVVLERREWVALAALAALAGWTAVSTAWSIQPPRSLLEAERICLYLAGFAVVLVAVDRSSLRQVVTGALAGMTVVSAVGLGEHYLASYPRNPIEGTLLIQPLGYANALGIYAAMGILLASGLALSLRERRARVAAAAPIALLAPTLALTSSRGAWAALPVGAVAMLYLGRRIRSRAALLALLAAGIVAGIAIGSNRGQAVSAVGQNRPHYWHVALDEYQSRPVLGGGAGTFGDYFWRYHRPKQGFTLDAHSLYLESLGELGPVGLALLLLVLGVPLAALRGRQSSLVAAVGGAYIAFLVHAAVDWDWKVPAVTLTGLFCGAAVLVAARRGRSEAVPPRARVALLAAALALAVFSSIRVVFGPNLGV